MSKRSKRWQVKNRKRIDDAIAALTKSKFWEPEDDRTEEEKEAEHQTSAAKVVQYYHLGRQISGSLPINGQSIYYVVPTKKKLVRLLHPVYLDTVKLSRRTFEKGVQDILLPEEFRKNASGSFNATRLADNMLAKMKEYCSRKPQRRFPQLVVRRAIADLKQIRLDQVPEYLEPSALEQYQKERKLMKDYQKRADNIVRKAEKVEKKGKKKEDVMKAGKGKKEKVSKKEKKEKKQKGKAVKAEKKSRSSKVLDFREFKPLKGKTARVAVVNFMAKNKKATLEKLRAYAEKHAGKTVTEARARKRIGDAARFFKKFGMTLAIGKGDKVTLS